MSRKRRPGGGRGRPTREYHIRVRAERRDEMDFAKLAQAALEQAAMDQQRNTVAAPTIPRPDGRPIGKEPHHDDLE